MENVKACKSCNTEANRLVKLMCESCYKKELYKQNRDKFQLRNKSYYARNKEKILAEKKIYQVKNNDIINQKHRQFYANNRSKIIKQNLAYIIKRSKTDIAYRVSRNLRARLNKAVVNDFKNSSAVRDLGCSIAEFKAYLESKFTDKMSWDNYGRKGWHIDHIVPISKFDLLNPTQAKLACHYTNLQPLWWSENLKKGNRDAI
jgi:5-methylcytosine-specific restriction endonuclease McrA